MPTLESGTAKVGRVKFYNFRKNPVLRVPPRYWRCRALSVPATLVLSASNPREPGLPWSPLASLVGAIVGLMGSGGTLVLPASNPREPRLPWSPTASLVGAIVGLMGCPLVRLGVP